MSEEGTLSRHKVNFLKLFRSSGLDWHFVAEAKGKEGERGVDKRHYCTEDLIV
jgi:hypothetical protein